MENGTNILTDPERSTTTEDGSNSSTVAIFSVLTQNAYLIPPRIDNGTCLESRAEHLARFAACFDIAALQEVYSSLYLSCPARAIVDQSLRLEGYTTQNGPACGFMDVADSGLMTATKKRVLATASHRFSRTARSSCSVHAFTALGAVLTSVDCGELTVPGHGQVQCVTHVVNVHLQSDNRFWDVRQGRFSSIRIAQMDELRAFLTTNLQRTGLGNLQPLLDGLNGCQSPQTPTQTEASASAKTAHVLLVAGDLNVDALADAMTAERIQLMSSLGLSDAIHDAIRGDCTSTLPRFSGFPAAPAGFVGPLDAEPPGEYVRVPESDLHRAVTLGCRGNLLPSADDCDSAQAVDHIWYFSPPPDRNARVRVHPRNARVHTGKVPVLPSYPSLCGRAFQDESLWLSDHAGLSVDFVFEADFGDLS